MSNSTQLDSTELNLTGSLPERVPCEGRGTHRPPWRVQAALSLVQGTDPGESPVGVVMLQSQKSMPLRLPVCRKGSRSMGRVAGWADLCSLQQAPQQARQVLQSHVVS